jgi:hypothetical protein
MERKEVDEGIVMVCSPTTEEMRSGRILEEMALADDSELRRPPACPPETERNK